MFDLDLAKVEHHPAMQDIVDVLCTKTSNLDRGFFQAETAYFLGQMASCMRAMLVMQVNGEIPVNVYALALANSGYGKGHSVNIMEEDFFGGFRKRFVEETFPIVSEDCMNDLANERAARMGTDVKEEYDKIQKEVRSYGSFTFVFSEATSPAIKQLRNLLLLTGIGSICFQMDEIGLNLSGAQDALTSFLELYDLGKIKPKLTKNTNDNQRFEEIQGKTPTNMLLFGTPSKLLDGGTTEDLFYGLLETGFARRCFFGYGHNTSEEELETDGHKLWEKLMSNGSTASITQWANHFTALADPNFYNWKIEVPTDVNIELLSYRLSCEARARQLPEHEEIKKSEIAHRASKALKLAGAYAFVDMSAVLTMDHLYQAIKFAEESGESFQTLLTREKAYAKLAKFIAESDSDVTHADMLEKLPFYKSGQAARNDQIMLATSWGYRNGIVISKKYIDNIEFFSGEKLQETNLNEVILSYSDHHAYHFEAVQAPWEDLGELMTAPDMGWSNHTYKNEHRQKETILPQFNMIVVDIDGTVSLDTVHELLKDYTFMTHTTKRHTAESHRFRLVIPMQYVLKLDRDDYMDFMESFLAWLPFKVDSGSTEPERRWSTYEHADVQFNKGSLIDPFPFIPRTSRNEDYKKQFKALGSLDNLQRWFASRISSGNRNVNMHKYAMALVDSGMSFADVENNVYGFNKMLQNPLDEEEIDKTIMTSVAKEYM